MMSVSQILYPAAAVGYSLAFLAGMEPLVGKRPGRTARAATAFFMLAAFLCQTAGMVWRGVALGRCPIDGAGDLLQVVVWSLVAMYAIVGAAFRTSLLGLFTSGLAAALCVLAAFAAGGNTFGPVPGGILVHAWLSLFSYGAFSLLALTSLMYLLQLYGLRKRRWAGLFRFLPSLRELEVVNFRLLVVGTAGFTVALGFGAAWYFRGYGIGAAKVALSCILWAGYAAALAARLSGRLYGRRLAGVCLALFALAMITLYPVAEHHVAAAKPAEAEVVR